MKIYLAGKISANDWRFQIVDGLSSSMPSVIVSRKEHLQNGCDWPILHGSIFGQHDYVGPFFIPLDRTSEFVECEGHRSQEFEDLGHGQIEFRYGPALNAVAELCLERVRLADLIFVWIDGPEPYGTCIEAGFGLALGKRVVLGKTCDSEDCWACDGIGSGHGSECDYCGGSGKAWSHDERPPTFWFLESACEVVRGDSPRGILESVLGIKPNYYAYIRSPEWKAKSDAAKRRAGGRCQVCNRHATEITLDAHHRTYERLGNELPEDITVLCRECHELYETTRKAKLNGRR